MFLLGEEEHCSGYSQGTSSGRYVMPMGLGMDNSGKSNYLKPTRQADSKK
jgi:hypothetical protein